MTDDEKKSFIDHLKDGDAFESETMSLSDLDQMNIARKNKAS